MSHFTPISSSARIEVNAWKHFQCKDDKGPTAKPSQHIQHSSELCPTARKERITTQPGAALHVHRASTQNSFSIFFAIALLNFPRAEKPNQELGDSRIIHMLCSGPLQPQHALKQALLAHLLPGGASLRAATRAEEERRGRAAQRGAERSAVPFPLAAPAGARSRLSRRANKDCTWGHHLKVGRTCLSCSRTF